MGKIFIFHFNLVKARFGKRLASRTMKKTKRSIQWVKEKTKKEYAGTHLIVEFWHGKIIEDSKKVEEILIQAVKEAKSTPLETVFHKFSPQGLTGVILLAESHIAYHSWPEANYLAIDIFTCGDKAMPFKALDYLKKTFEPEKVEIKTIKRGRL